MKVKHVMKNLKLRKIVFQEAIRSIALGWIMFMIMSLLYHGGAISLQAAWQIPLVFTGMVFAGFTLARLLTGRDFVIRTAKGWFILAALLNASLLIVVILGVSLGLEDSLLKYGILPYIAAFVLVGLLTWGSYRASRRHSDNGEDA
jgi:hypothetical protein